MLSSDPLMKNSIAELHIKKLNHFLTVLWKKLENALSYSLFVFVSAYRTIGTTFLGGTCRFTPSCSEYALQAIKEEKPILAIKHIFIRIIKCRPGGPFGYDPLPSCCGEKKNESK